MPYFFLKRTVPVATSSPVIKTAPSPAIATFFNESGPPPPPRIVSFSESCAREGGDVGVVVAAAVAAVGLSVGVGIGWIAPRTTIVEIVETGAGAGSGAHAHCSWVVTPPAFRYNGRNTLPPDGPTEACL